MFCNCCDWIAIIGEMAAFRQIANHYQHPEDFLSDDGEDFQTNVAHAAQAARSNAALLGTVRLPPPAPARKARGPKRRVARAKFYYLPDLADLPTLSNNPPDPMIRQHSTSGYGKA